MSDKNDNKFSTLWVEFQDFLKLNLDYARLTAAEKLTMLLVAISLCLIGFVLVSLILFFASMALIGIIARSTGLVGAELIMGGFYVFMLVLVIAFRRPLIVNPISRFVSKLFL